VDIGEVEKQVFRKIISNPGKLAENICKVSPDDFSIKIAKIVVTALSKHGYAAHYTPNKNFFEILLRDQIHDKKSLESSSEMLAGIAKVPIDTKDLDILIKELKNNRMCSNLTAILKKAVPIIKPDTVEEAYDQVIRDLLQLPLQASAGVSVATVREVHDTLDERVMSYTDVGTKKYPTGIQAFDKSMGGFAQGEFVILAAGTGMGKCCRRGTKILKYSGKSVSVETIQDGDLLMGPDSKPRRVLSTTSGTGEMYRITPTNGEPWECNSQHILTLVHAETGKIIDIGVQDYLKQTKKFKREHEQFFVGVDFPNSDKKLPIDPYSLGVRYGDEAKAMKPAQATMTNAYGLSVRADGSVESPCSTHTIRGEHGSDSQPHGIIRQVIGACERIPHEYLTAARSDRAALLAGLLDTDGIPSFVGFDIVQKRKGLAEGICFLARSLGLRALMSEKGIDAYPDSIRYRVNIVGDFAILPLRIKRKIPTVGQQKRDVTRTAFSVEPVGIGQYFGFELDSDGRFLLGDFTVTHNSNVMLWWAEKFVSSGANVLYATIEMSYEETMNRYHAIATGFPTTDISNKRIPPGKLHRYYEKLISHAKDPGVRSAFLEECKTILDRDDPRYALKIAKKYKNRRSKFFVLDIDSCSPSRVEREIQRISLDHKIDYVFVDFINVMDPEFHNRDRVRELSSIARDLKKVARKTKSILISACQLDTTSLEGTQEERITNDRIKYARAIGENADWVIAFNRTEEDNRLKQIRLQLAKHRHSADVTALIEFDFSTLQALDLGFAPGTEPPEFRTENASASTAREDDTPSWVNDSTPDSNNDPGYEDYGNAPSRPPSIIKLSQGTR
jgi:replicative DNA helicase